MFQRKKTKQIQIGNVKIGGGADISVQSMLNTDTRDVNASLKQIYELNESGCELIRLAVPDFDAAEAIGEIKKKSPLPLIADIHFDYRLALKCIDKGIDALRINPGNIGSKEHTKAVSAAAGKNKIPIRIGINGGSLEKQYAALDLPLPEKMLMSAMRHIKILEDNDFDLIKISMKSSNVPSMIEAYRLISEKTDYPLHLGVTEAGTKEGGIIKSAAGIGALLAEGIGDTIRVSLTDEPLEEVKAGYMILKAMNLRQRGINFISCPACGRTQIDLIKLAEETEKRLADIDKPLTIAVMGCAVNGPGEASHADYGIAGGKKEGYIFKKGQIIKRLPEDRLLDEFVNLIKSEI